MNDSINATPFSGQPRAPIILEFNDVDYPPLPNVSVPMAERFRNVPTRQIQEYLDMGVFTPETRAAALAELARRGTVPPAA